MAILIKHFFYAGLIFAFMITGIVAVINEVIVGEKGNEAKTAVPGLMTSSQVSDFNESFYPKNLTSSITELETKMKGLQPTSDNPIANVITFAGAMVATAWGMVDFIIDSFGFMGGAIGSLEGSVGLPIPGWVGTFVILLITVLFIFGIISLIFGKET